MAQSKPLRTGYQNCFICFTEFTHPKPLPGSHACLNDFCRKCLKDYSSESIANRAGDDKSSCPKCNDSFTISDEVMKTIWYNESTSNGLANARCRKRKAEHSKCDLCENVNAESFCIECKQGLCLQCKQVHSKLSSTKIHKIVDVIEKDNDVKIEDIKFDNCSKHIGSMLTLYCCDCNEMLCNLCHTSDHDNHNCMSSVEAVKSKIYSVMKYEELIENCCENERKHSKNLYNSESKYHKQILKIETLTEELFADLTKILEERKAVVLKRLRQFKDKHAGNMKSQLNESHLHMNELHRFLSDLRMMKESGTATEISRAIDDLQKRATELIQLQDERDNEKQRSATVRLIKPPDEIKKDVKQALMGVNVDDSQKMPGCCKWNSSNLPARKVSRQLLNVEKGTNVRGLTIVDDVIYQLLDDGKSQAYAFDKDTFVIEPTINVPGMKRPRDLVGCEHNKALYISDQGRNCILKVDLMDNTVERGEIEKNEAIQGMSVTPIMHDLLITVWIKNTDGRSKVLEFSDDLYLSKEIELDASIRYAQQTVETYDDHYIVLYGSGSANGIGLVNWEGSVIERFDIPQNGDMKEHRSLAIDHNTGRVFLADHNRNAVIMFSRDLIRLGMIQMTEGSASPGRIFFDCSTDRLYMSQGGHNRCVSVINPEEFTTRNNYLGLHEHSKDT